jgi:UDP-N-acetylglucosamine diphosphorylase/glucosamine-1-phosphate N-acetyltransferase
MLKEKIKILILAGGKGKRMQSDLPKVLVPLKNKAMILHIIEELQKLNLGKPISIVGHQRYLVQDALKDLSLYAIQEEQLGTGHAVSCAKDQCINAEQILILSGDQPLITKETISNLINKQIETKAKITFATTDVPDFLDWRKGFLGFGRILRDGEKVIGIKEYKDATEEEKEIKEVNAGSYIFQADWLWNNLDKIKNNNAQNEYYLTDLFKIAFEEKEKIETVSISPREALGANTKEELEILENIV